MSEEIKVMYASDEAAHPETVTGWVSRDGHFWGKDEHMARWSGCTHLKCECGAEMSKHYIRCNACQKKLRDTKFEALPIKEWDGKTPLVIYNTDRYFFTDEELSDYCDEEGVLAGNLQLMLCEPVRLHSIDPDDYCHDYLPEDTYLEDVEPELAKAFHALNEVIEKTPPLSWMQGGYRASVILDRDNKE